MEIAVRDAAERLGISEPRVRQLLASGDLAGRRLGRVWLVSAESVTRMRGRGTRLPGRPLGPRRAWALLDLLAGGDAGWLSPSARSQVRTRLRGLAGAAPGQWRAALRGRSDVLPCIAHPAAISRLAGQAGVLPAGLAALRGRAFDLVIPQNAVDQAYADPALWPALSAALVIQPAGPEHLGTAPNLTVHLPRVGWPFRGRTELPDSVLAADLLDSAEPRAVRAGAQRLDELLEEHVR